MNRIMAKTIVFFSILKYNFDVRKKKNMRNEILKLAGLEMTFVLCVVQGGWLCRSNNNTAIDLKNMDHSLIKSFTIKRSC